MLPRLAPKIGREPGAPGLAALLARGVAVTVEHPPKLKVAPSQYRQRQKRERTDEDLLRRLLQFFLFIHLTLHHDRVP